MTLTRLSLDESELSLARLALISGVNERIRWISQTMGAPERTKYAREALAMGALYYEICEYQGDGNDAKVRVQSWAIDVTDAGTIAKVAFSQ